MCGPLHVEGLTLENHVLLYASSVWPIFFHPPPPPFYLKIVTNIPVKSRHFSIFFGSSEIAPMAKENRRFLKVVNFLVSSEVASLFVFQKCGYLFLDCHCCFSASPSQKVWGFWTVCRVVDPKFAIVFIRIGNATYVAFISCLWMFFCFWGVWVVGCILKSGPFKYLDIL